MNFGKKTKKVMKNLMSYIKCKVLCEKLPKELKSVSYIKINFGTKFWKLM